MTNPFGHCPRGGRCDRYDPELARPCPNGMGASFYEPRPTPCIKTATMSWNPRLNLPCGFNGLVRVPIIIGPTPPPGPSLFLPF